MSAITQINDLIDSHPGEYVKCKGCEICDRINELQSLEYRYRHLLDKGTDLKPSEIKILIDKGIDKEIIRKKMKMSNQEFYKMLKNLKVEKIKIGEEQRRMAKFALSRVEVELLKEEGKSKTEIAKIAGVKPATLSYYEKKWKSEPETETEAYEKALKQLENKLKQANKQSNEYKTMTEKLQAKIDEYEEVVKLKDEQNLQLVKKNQQTVAKINELETQLTNLHSAAHDTEKEAAAAHEYIEKEQNLLLDKEMWERKAVLWKEENHILTEVNKELRLRLNELTNESQIAREYIKVLLV